MSKASKLGRLIEGAKKAFIPQKREDREHHKMLEANKPKAVAIYNQAVAACRELGFEIAGEIVLLNPMQAHARVNIFPINLTGWKKRQEAEKAPEEKANTEAVEAPETTTEAPKASEEVKAPEAATEAKPERQETTEKAE